MPELPTGTVTFLFTDIEGSTRLLEHLGDDTYDKVLGQHHRIIREAIASHHGVEVDTEGDAFFVVFADASEAVAMVVAAQIALGRLTWTDQAAIRVRMGLHTGPGRLGGEGYVGLAVHQAARICSAAHGGQVVASAAVRLAAGDMAGGASWRSLGRHRLKDLGAPTELFQLCHSNLLSEFPSLRSLERVRHNLPVQASSFLGRHEELTRGAEMLATTRLLSVTGPGGSGKTRFAYQLAAEQLAQFPDGVWVAELASLSDTGLVPAALMAALGLRDEPGRSATEMIVSHLRAQQALVVLDNCEHLIEAAAALSADLLRGCERLRVLATTREPLRVRGEAVWALGPLGVPEDSDLPLEFLAGTDAVALFCERAAEAKVGFCLSSDNAAAVRTICARLEGMPLAIELAAARVRTLPLTQISVRLGRSLDLLTKGTRGVGDRQGSLRGAIAWSHDLLSPTEKTLFRRLAVFAGGFSLDAAESVCASEGLDAVEVMEALDGLVDKSLVTLGEERAGQGRYRLLETVRAYADEQLQAAGETLVLAGQHAAFYARLAHDCAEEAEATTGLDRLEADHSNLLAALEHLSGGDPIEHGQLATNLSSFWDLRGHWRLAHRELVRYLARANRDQALAARCARGLGLVAYRLGDFPEAQTQFEEALRIARGLGERRLEGSCIGGLGNVLFELGDYREARARYEQALTIARELGDSRMAGVWLGDLAGVAFNLGDYHEARARYEEALGIARELGDRSSEGRWLGNLGTMVLQLGDYSEARAHYEEALRIARELGERSYETAWAGELGELATKLGDYPEARARLEEALGIARELGDRNCEGYWTGDLGELATRLGDYPEARARYEEALGIACELGERGYEGYWTGNLGELAAKLGEYPEAQARFEEALDIACQLGDRPNEALWVRGLGVLACDLGNYPQARVNLERALRIALDLGNQDSPLLEACAGLLARLDHCADAAKLLAAADAFNTRGHKVRGASEQARYDTSLVACRSRLGEEIFASASELGRALEWASAVEIALEVLGQT